MRLQGLCCRQKPGRTTRRSEGGKKPRPCVQICELCHTAGVIQLVEMWLFLLNWRGWRKPGCRSDSLDSVYCLLPNRRWLCVCSKLQVEDPRIVYLWFNGQKLLAALSLLTDSSALEVQILKNPVSCFFAAKKTLCVGSNQGVGRTGAVCFLVVFMLRLSVWIWSTVDYNPKLSR